MPEPRYITIENNREEKREAHKLQNKAKEDFSKTEEAAHQVPGQEKLPEGAVPIQEDESA